MVDFNFNSTPVYIAEYTDQLYDNNLEICKDSPDMMELIILRDTIKFLFWSFIVYAVGILGHKYLGKYLNTIHIFNEKLQLFKIVSDFGLTLILLKILVTAFEYIKPY